MLYGSLNFLPMLEYFKTVLQKVSFDPYLFEKELKKAINFLIPQELKEFRDWCYIRFGEIYSVILDKNFAHVTV